MSAVILPVSISMTIGGTNMGCIWAQGGNLILSKSSNVIIKSASLNLSNLTGFVMQTDQNLVAVQILCDYNEKAKAYQKADER